MVFGDCVSWLEAGQDEYENDGFIVDDEEEQEDGGDSDEEREKKKKRKKKLVISCETSYEFSFLLS